MRCFTSILWTGFLFFPPGPLDSGLPTNQILIDGASPRKPRWGACNYCPAWPGQALPTCPRPFSVRAYCLPPYLSAHSPRMIASNSRLPHLWSRVHLGHGWEGSWWTSSPLCPGKPLLQSERWVISPESVVLYLSPSLSLLSFLCFPPVSQLTYYMSSPTHSVSHSSVISKLVYSTFL